MKKIASFLIICLLSYHTKAQSYLETPDGRVLFDGHEVNVEGTVYIPQEFKKGYLKFSNERKMTIPQVRFNSYDNRIEFKEGKEEKVLTLPIVEFGFEEAAGSMRVFKKGFPAIDRQNDGTFYEIAFDGKFKLLKYFKAHKFDVSGYNSATKTMKFDINETLYLLKSDNTIVKVKKDKKSLLEALGKDESAVKDWWSKEKPNLKNETDLKAFLAYLDTL
ncbi:hypothetical protein [Flectobacillus roseus]|uniref:hypothetical protein n=1 Tax=Flectobacillus roseus TaxID=502259 RepID=UPI0024B7998F|nr:hypothetical protein [Flectobacillus roseus]MDI9870196.1 hypothetical protein [Flectobacillus roseus]